MLATDLQFQEAAARVETASPIAVAAVAVVVPGATQQQRVRQAATAAAVLLSCGIRCRGM